MFKFLTKNINLSKENILKDIEFIKEQIEINNLSINNLNKFGGNTKYLQEQNLRYKSILNTLEKSVKNA
jgi:hypothetical protein